MVDEGDDSGTNWNEEALCEKRAISLFEELGYAYTTGAEVSPESSERERLSEFYLKSRLREAIKRLNPWINGINLARAANSIVKAREIDTIHTNSDIHNKLVRHISLEQDLGHGKKGQTVRFIDFENPENNDFLVVSQMKFAGPEENIIPDLTIYLNGMPVGVIECKSPTVRRPKEKAVTQLRRYQNIRKPDLHEGYEDLFYANQILVAAWGQSAAGATIGARYEHFKEWKDPYPATIPELKELLRREPTGQDILIYSLFKKDRLLDLIQNYTVFEEKGAGLVKMMARYQQYRAAEKALKRVKQREGASQRGGVVWHTQGSGKSLTMLFLAIKLKRLLDNPTILIVTDRRELDKQISQTFERCDFPNPIHAENIKHLRQELKLDVGQTILTIIHKFEEPDDAKDEVLNDSSNIYVMADEAHRTQYNILANFMRTALPNACYLGFTGTPIEKKYKNTRDTFGTYIDTYTIDESVEDGVTVPIKYETRMTNMWVEGRTLDEIFERVFANKSKKERELIKSRYANEQAIAESEQRITQICLDIIEHYENHIESNGTKGQIVTVSRRAAARYKEKLDELGGPESVVIYSEDENDSPLLKKYHNKDRQHHLIERFKKPRDEDSLSLLVVCNMLITGFDAPVEQVMYLDKPLKEHNLLQAIARVNRPYPRKNYGLIVDYYGISEYLPEALEMFTKSDIENALKPLEDELPRLEMRHRSAMSFFDDVDMNNVEACARVLEPKDIRMKFDIAFRKFSQSMDMMMPHPDARPFLGDLKKLGKIRRYAKNMYRDEDIDIAGAGEKVRELIDEYIRAEGVDHLLEEPVSILAEDFSESVEQHESEEAKASEMEHAIKHEITVRTKENPVVYHSLKERLEEIIEKRKQQRIATSEAIEKYGLIIREIKDIQEGVVARRMGMDEDEYAFFETLKEDAPADDDGEVDRKELKDVTKKILPKLKEQAVIDFRRKWDVQREMRASIKRILAREGWPRDRIEAATSRLMELAEVRL